MYIRETCSCMLTPFPEYPNDVRVRRVYSQSQRAHPTTPFLALAVRQFFANR